MKTKYVGNLALIPFLSDSYYSLFIDLIKTSKRYPDNISFPAGTVLIGVACIESYINELIFMWSFDRNSDENSRIKKSLEKYDTLKKIRYLKKYAEFPDELDDELVDDFRWLVALRGRILHFTVQEEYPNDASYLSKLEKLERHLFGKNVQRGLVSTQRILTPSTAEIVGRIVFGLIARLYKSGYEPPRPRWIELIDTGRFDKGSKE